MHNAVDNFDDIGEKAPILGARFNEGKPRYDLIPPAPIKALAIHYGMGSKKYEARNWEKGLSFADTLRALESHMTEYKLGHRFDVEDPKMPGYIPHHLIAVIWNAIALYEMERRRIGVNDLPEAQFDV